MGMRCVRLLRSRSVRNRPIVDRVTVYTVWIFGGGPSLNEWPVGSSVLLATPGRRTRGYEHGAKV